MSKHSGFPDNLPHWSPFNTGIGKTYEYGVSKPFNTLQQYEYHLAVQNYFQKKGALEELNKALQVQKKIICIQNVMKQRKHWHKLLK